MPEYRTVIHRDMTFVYEGETYNVIQGGPKWGYAIHDRHSGVVLVDGFDSLNQVRDYVDECRHGDWRIGEGYTPEHYDQSDAR